MGRRDLTLLLSALATLGAGCASAKGGVAPQCQDSHPCSDGLACVGGSCIPRATPPGNWGVELEPRSDSSAGLTEYNAVSFGSGPLQLMADAKIGVTGTLASDSSTPTASAAHVVITVPSAIPGRPDLQFEADLAASVDNPALRQVTLPVSQGFLGRMATIQIIPKAPDDRLYPPVTLKRTLTAALPLVVPSQTYPVTGRFFDAIRSPRLGFLARAFRDGQLVSNVDVTDNAGSFSLSIPVATVAFDPLRPFSVELKPMDPTASDPRFTSRLFALAGNLDLGSLYQAAFTQPNAFRFAVRGGTDSGPPVSGAIVRAQTVLASDASGSTDFLRDAQTDSAGIVDLTLLPGTTTASRQYAVAVIPPAGSDYGALCLSTFPLAAGGAIDAPANVQAIVLPRRPVVTGTVLAADGTPVPRVVVAVARATVATGTGCAEAAASPPASTATDSKGTFRLLLDPGSYVFDYDPPAGSSVPRMTESGVTIAGDITHVAQLPPGGLVEGDALGPDGATPLPSAAVRLYEVRCASAAACAGAARLEPLLRGQTRTDARGHFRAVIPLPGS